MKFMHARSNTAASIAAGTATGAAPRIATILALALALSACPAPRRPAPPEGPPPSMPAPAQTFPGAVAYRIVPEQSLVRILALRGGKLASAGHNHVIASHDLGGTVWLHEEPGHSGFQIAMPVAQLAVDEQELRKDEGPEFAREVPQSAREGTLRNLLGAELLQADQFPLITLTSVQVTGTFEQLQARTRVEIRGQAHEIDVPVSVERAGNRLTATGEFAVRQSELGLAPFTVMLGALQVQDELKVKFRIVAATEP